MNNLKLVVIFFITSTLLMSCEIEQKTDSKQAEQTEQLLSEANKQIGMPAILNYQEKKLFKQILELRDQENVITYCYLMNELEGTIGQFLGKGVGYGIPAATQFTNPEKYRYRNGSSSTLPQADPNGLFMPTSTSATWYMLLDEKGVPRAVYIEPLIIVSPIKLH